MICAFPGEVWFLLLCRRGDRPDCLTHWMLCLPYDPLWCYELPVLALLQRGASENHLPICCDNQLDDQACVTRGVVLFWCTSVTVLKELNVTSHIESTKLLCSELHTRITEPPSRGEHNLDDVLSSVLTKQSRVVHGQGETIVKDLAVESRDMSELYVTKAWLWFLTERTRTKSPNMPYVRSFVFQLQFNSQQDLSRTWQSYSSNKFAFSLKFDFLCLGSRSKEPI